MYALSGDDCLFSFGLILSVGTRRQLEFLKTLAFDCVNTPHLGDDARLTKTQGIHRPQIDFRCRTQVPSQALIRSPNTRLRVRGLAFPYRHTHIHIRTSHHLLFNYEPVQCTLDLDLPPMFLIRPAAGFEPRESSQDPRSAPFHSRCDLDLPLQLYGNTAFDRDQRSALPAAESTVHIAGVDTVPVCAAAWT